MIEGSARVHPERSKRLRQLRSRLPKLADPLEIVAEQILGLESRIDFVAKDRRGQVVLVFLADRGSDLGLLADSLAQRSWMEPRVADWLKLAPQLGLRPELGVRVLLLAPDPLARSRLPGPNSRALARISHQLATAAADSTTDSRPSPSGRLDVLPSTPSAPSGPRAANLRHSRRPRYATR